jgi:antitoxin ParD1/3/4
MNVSLTPELERFVQDKVASGLYNSASEVIREALRLLREQDIVRQRRLEELRTEIALGIEQADRGEIGNFDAEDLKRRVRERIENNHSSEDAHEQTV